MAAISHAYANDSPHLVFPEGNFLLAPFVRWSYMMFLFFRDVGTARSVPAIPALS